MMPTRRFQARMSRAVSSGLNDSPSRIMSISGAMASGWQAGPGGVRLPYRLASATIRASISGIRPATSMVMCGAT